MAVAMFLSRSSSIASLVKCLGIWFVLCCLEFQAQGQVTFHTTVRTARCIANCYSAYGGRNNDSENICQTPACRQCLPPCEKTFHNEALCIESCNNSSSCEASCRFLTHLKNFSSITTGDGSSTPTPGIPTVTKRTFTSITLQWEPVKNTSGIPVYMVATELTGDSVRPSYFFRNVFTVPRATLETSSLCAGVSKHGLQDVGAGFPRSSFNGIYYKFHVAVLTENSSISYGAKTTENITPLIPQPVSNITVASIVYDSSRPKNKLKLNVAWARPADSSGISNYAIHWLSGWQCDQQIFQVTTIKDKADTNGTFYIYEEIKKCSSVLRVYALNNCIPGNGTTYTFRYPGCANITDYPKEKCYKFDPPYSPTEELRVRNITYRLASINDDYTFNMNVTWDPPLYPYKKPIAYFLRWEKLRPDLNDFGGFRIAYGTSATVGPFRPKEICTVHVKPKQLNLIFPSFEGATPSNEDFSKNISITTPEVNPAQVTVRNLTLTNFIFSPQNGTFELNVTWEKPSFNHSKISEYLLSYKVNEENMAMVSTDKTSFYISGIVHGAPIAFNVTPQYVHQWIRREKTCRKATAPEPYSDEVIVRNLMLNSFILSPITRTYDLNVSWEKPLFNYSKISTYTLKFRVHKGHQIFAETNKTNFIIHGFSFGEPVELSVTPHFMNRRIVGREYLGKTEAPLPDDEEIKVQNLQARGFVEDEKSNTFAVNFTWNPPPFEYRDVLYYNLSYEFSGFTRNQFPCSSSVESSRCKISGLRETFFQISGILPQEHISIQVTPIYNDEYIKGKPRGTDEYSSPAPRGELLTVVGLKHDKLVPSSSSSFRTTVKWQKPLFIHSNVTHYIYTITKKNEEQIQRRAVDVNTAKTTTKTEVPIDGIHLNEEIEFQVTPEFAAHAVMGIQAKISILKTETPKAAPLDGSLTPAGISGLVIGLLLLTVICLMLFWRHRKGKKKGGDGWMIDHWEVDGDLVSLEEELGEGAFGKVYKGALKEPTSPSQKLSLISSKKGARTIDGRETFVVAVKMLHDMSDSDQRREFLEEIQLMKTVGSHKNIVNMIGCCTVEEPMFLLVEYVPYGDLLHYLRKHRGKLKESLADDSHGPYRSTYCETYFTNANSTGISVKASKDDRIYVNAPWMAKEEDGAIQLLSFNSSTTPGDQIQTGEENKGLDTEEEQKEDCNEEFLTPGDLMAFAWQISQGMEYLAKQGFVHRDLAARNVLVGEKKIAKVADFGLTRHVYEGRAYQAKQSRKLPLKWMSIEAIFEQTFTTQSDVWAFGVVLWELVTLGGTPYPTIDNKELLRLLKDGYRMEKPDTCNEELYKMMTDCWQEIHERRPNFTQIRESLETMMQKDNPYLDLTAMDESRDYYSVPSFNSIMEESADEDNNDDINLAKTGSAGDPKENIAEEDQQILKQTLDIDKNTENQQNKNGYDVKDSKDPKDVVINFNTMERSICRSTGQGYAF